MENKKQQREEGGGFGVGKSESGDEKEKNLLKKENAFFHVGEDVSIKDQSPFQCNSRLNAAKTGLNYNQSLQCDNRFSCSAVKFMFAHTNAAYVSFLNILRSASIGAMIKKGYLMAVYNDMRGVSNKGMIKGYGKNFLMSHGIISHSVWGSFSYFHN